MKLESSLRGARIVELGKCKDLFTVVCASCPRPMKIYIRCRIQEICKICFLMYLSFIKIYCIVPA